MRLIFGKLSHNFLQAHHIFFHIFLQPFPTIKYQFVPPGNTAWRSRTIYSWKSRELWTTRVKGQPCSHPAARSKGSWTRGRCRLATPSSPCGGSAPRKSSCRRGNMCGTRFPRGTRSGGSPSTWTSSPAQVLVGGRSGWQTMASTLPSTWARMSSSSSIQSQLVGIKVI